MGGRQGAWGALTDGRFALRIEGEAPGVWHAFARLRTLVQWCEVNAVHLLNRDAADEVLAFEPRGEPEGDAT
jgi:hypothetical protein